LIEAMSGPFHYDNRRAVVTGGAKGIGAALLVRLAELGATAVTVLDLERPTGPHDQFIRTDLSDPLQVDGAAQEIADPICSLFNNAGVAGTAPRDTVFAVNFLAMRRLIARLTDRLVGGGAIVNTASIAGSGWPNRLDVILGLLEIEDWTEAAAWFASRDDLGDDPYGFTKECAQVYTMWSGRTLASRGVRINAVAPGPVDTGLLPDFRATMTDTLIDWTVSQGDGRMVTADDVACVLAFLGSDASRSLNGTIIPIDRGFLAAGTTGQLDLTALGG
jgi:NAD(P)-dependent dehydrogenase (short-subunit alcohol dehydrogenase family)